MQIGDKVRVKLKEITDNIDRGIDGRIGTLESNNFDPSVPYDYCVRIGRILFGIKADELEEVQDD